MQIESDRAANSADVVVGVGWKEVSEYCSSYGVVILRNAAAELKWLKGAGGATRRISNQL